MTHDFQFVTHVIKKSYKKVSKKFGSYYQIYELCSVNQSLYKR